MPALDGVRGLAILFVMLYHFTLYGGMEPTLLVDKLYYRAALVGWFGVDLFFVLSGFLITGILYDSVSRPRYFRNFYMRRVLRIFPLYYGALVLAFLIIPRLVEVSPAYGELLEQQGWYWSYLVNVKIAIDYWPGLFALGHFWSLAVEEQFYLVWPLAVFFLKRRALIKLCLFGMAGALALRIVLVGLGSVTAAYVLTPSRADALAAGAVLALVARGPRGLSVLARWTLPTLVSAGGALAALMVLRGGLGTEQPIVVTLGFSLLVLLFGALLLLALGMPARPGPQRLFCHPVLAFFGRYSYGLYVFHHPVAIYLGGALSVASMPRLLGSQLGGQLAFLVVAAGLSLALAIPSWHLYESRFLRLKRLFRAPPAGAGSADRP